ncbi:TylF/MycF/NovP-related O-methyltransferase [Methylocystis sp. JAN1]|uniref:TylF/MycF/NovP-related O-methyltransferase n=1 Tax=Methylocystis sp. JAN1 TaxID=3397211 RepID=UPI003FA1E1C8
MEAVELYLNLLKRSLTNTLFEEEPDADNPNQTSYVSGFISHYIRGFAISMLPIARFDNLQSCILDTIDKGVPGDLIETGVWRGGATIFMRAMLKAYGVNDKRVWVADSFQGLPEPDAEKFPVEANFHNSKIMKSYYNNFAVSLEEVAANFKAYDMLDDQVKFLKGWFRDSLPTAPIEKLSIIRLDGDYYESTMDGLINLYDKLSIGGYVIVDDYGEDAWTNCRQAVDEFRTNRKIEDPLLRVDSRCYYWRRTS